MLNDNPVTPSIPVANVASTPINTTLSTPRNPNQKRNIFLAIGVMLLIVGVSSGIILIKSPVGYFSKAWDCGKYVFNLTENGQVVVVNGSSKQEALQRANVYINGDLASTVDVPVVNPGETKNLGHVDVPNTDFSWQIQGTSDCSNSGQYTFAGQYQCQLIKVLDSDKNEISKSDLSTLQPGDTVFFVAVGSGTNTNYTMARFKINGTQMPETDLKTDSGDYYEEYQIPSNQKTFTVTAELKGKDNNWH